MKVFVLLDDRENGADAARGVYTTLQLATSARDAMLAEEEDAVKEDYFIEEHEVNE